MKILFAALGYKPAYRIGGPIEAVACTAEHLVRKGHHVTVFTTNCNLDQDLDVPVNQPLDVNGVEVWYFRRKEILKSWLPFVPYVSKSIGFLYAPAMNGQLKKLVPKMDVVHTLNPFIYPTYATARAAREFGKPMFYSQHGALGPEHLKFRALKKTLYLNFIERPLMRQAASLIALTDAEVDSYRALGVDNPCEVVPNGTDVVNYRTQASRAFNQRWSIPPDALVILFLGRLHPIKGADKLLQAFFQIQTRFPQSRLVIAGPDECGLEPRFREDVSRAGLTDRVLFPGMVSGEEKLDWLARADVFALPSAAEGFSMATLEALASGTAVLLSPGCHFPEVQTAGAGRIVPRDATSIARALGELLAQPATLREMGESGRRFVGDHYDWSVIADRLLETYRRHLNRTSAETPGARRAA